MTSTGPDADIQPGSASTGGGAGKLSGLKTIFAREVSRAQLAALPQPQGRAASVHVFRNHNFELAAGIAVQVLAIHGVAAQFSYGGYDDSFSFADCPPADACLICHGSADKLKTLISDDDYNMPKGEESYG